MRNWLSGTMAAVSSWAAISAIVFNLSDSSLREPLEQHGGEL
jgi:hypothetical protein